MELVARGGSSSVFRAVQHSLGRQVALKILKPIYREVDAARFFDEGRIIAALNHSNIITIYDIGAIKSWYYIAMEFLDGGSLRERIGGEMPVDDALGLVESIGASLDFVHRKGVVHRDIKPANILFHADGTPKLTDFGIAKQLSTDQELTLDGRALGSPYYLSPEQAQCRSLDGRSDIYSLGVVLYEMLTGHRPYAGESHIDTILAHLTQPVPMLPDHLSSLQGLLNRMMAKAPQDRFETAGAMVEEVRRLRRSQLEGRPPTLLQKVADQWMSLSARSSYSPGQLAVVSGVVLVASAGLFGMLSIVKSDLQPANSSLETVQVGERPVSNAVPSDNKGINLEAVAEGMVVTMAAGAAGSEDRKAPDSASSTAPRESNEAVADLALEPVMPEIASNDGVLAPDTLSFQDQATILANPQQPFVANDEQGADPSGAAVALVGAYPSPMGQAGASAADAVSSMPPEKSAAIAAGVEAPAMIPPDQGDSGDPDPNGLTDVAAASQDGDEFVSEEQLQTWLALADKAFAAYRLTIPREDNAYYFYRKVLKVDSRNADAKRGIQRVAGAYAGLASREVSRQNLPKARAYVDRGLRIKPGHRKLTELDSQLEGLEASQQIAGDDPVKRFFKRVGDFLSGGPDGSAPGKGDGSGATQQESR